MIDYPLPNGTLSFDESRHRYEFMGQVIPGVTSIVNPPFENTSILMAWAAKMCGEYVLENPADFAHPDPVELSDAVRKMKRHYRDSRSKAGDIGTIVHEFAEAYMYYQWTGSKEPELPENEKAKRACLAFVEWVNRQEVIVHGLERKVLYTGAKGDLWPFAGTTDIDATINGLRVLGDWKTSTRRSPSMMAQLGGYDIALEEMEGTRFDAHMIVRFDRETGEIDHWQSDAVQLNREAFRACYRINKFKGVYGGS